MPLIAAAAIGAGGSIFGGLMGRAGAGQQAQAAQQASQLQYQASQNALNFQKQMWQQQQQQMQPWLLAGQAGVQTLSGDVLGGRLTQPWTKPFVAPTAATEMNDPGYRFRLQQGLQALQASAAAQGNLLTGGTARDIMNYGQQYASNEYQNVYNRALTQYQQAYNIFEQNQADRFNRLAALSGVGQTAAGQLGTFGTAATQGIAGNILGTAQGMAQAANLAGAARASGYGAMGQGIGGAMGGIGETVMLANLLRGGGFGGPGGGVISQVPDVEFAGNPLAGIQQAYGGGLAPGTYTGIPGAESS